MTDFEFNINDNMDFEHINYFKNNNINININDLEIDDNKFDKYINDFYNNIDNNIKINTDNFVINVDMNVDDITKSIDKNITIKPKPKLKHIYKSIICKEHKRFRYSCKDCYEYCIRLGYKSAYCEHLINKNKCIVCKDIVNIRSYKKK